MLTRLVPSRTAGSAAAADVAGLVAAAADGRAAAAVVDAGRAVAADGANPAGSSFETPVAGRADRPPALPPAKPRGFRSPGMPVAGGCGWGGAACATPWLRSG